jgi:UDP-2-acetamido-2-deoxy-ribo-hexuluronate aminotransferase
MREIRVHGQDRRYHHPRLGVNGRLDSLQAAVLLSKLDIFPDEVAARARLGARYTELIAEAFADVREPAQHVSGPSLAAGNTSVYAQYTIEVHHRDRVEQKMKELGIPTAVHYPVPLHLQPVFADLGIGAGSLPVAERAAGRVMSLPMHPYLTEEQQSQVIHSLKIAVAG